MNHTKTIAVIGAGKSATVLIDFLKEETKKRNWNLIVADYNLEIAKEKAGDATNVSAIHVDTNDSRQRRDVISQADIVISMMPPTLHRLIAGDCIELSKNLLTASYVSEDIREMADAIADKGLLFLCEMGLDPGIDHMSAMELFDKIKSEEGKITSFKSHCGGLVAPESDDNPWHYKISWNPRNVVMAGKDGAVFLEDGRQIKFAYENLFDENRTVEVPEAGTFAFYPNRDSSHYIDLYQLHDVNTFVRTTLRHPDFCAGWKEVVLLKLTSEKQDYDTNDLSLSAFFKQHLAKNATDTRLGYLLNFQEEAGEQHTFKDQMTCLGLNDDETKINKGMASAADVMQFTLEKNLALKEGDKDRIIMMHEIAYESNGQTKNIVSYLDIIGKNNLHTAMATTVGLPLGIAALLILEGKINEKGLHIPVIPSIYEPVLSELKNHGIAFKEQHR